MQAQITATLPNQSLVEKISNHPLLSRLIKEIAEDKDLAMRSNGKYDRTHNKHNRG